MGDTLQKRIDTVIRQVFAAGPGAWLVWCDPQRAWLPLLERVAGDRRLGGFDLVVVDARTAGAFGGPAERALLQAKIAAGQPFVLYAPVAPAGLGWLHAQALLAEKRYDRTLRAQLLDWGWRPHSLTVSDQEVAALARLNLQQDPAQWGDGGLQPDADLLLEVLAGFAEPSDENRLILDLSIQAAGLPPITDDLPAWRTRAVARLLVTQAYAAIPGAIADGHELLVEGACRAFARQLLDRWVDSHTRVQSLPDAVIQADRLAALGGLLAQQTAAGTPCISQAAEAAIFANACNQLAALEGRPLLEELAAQRTDFERHARGLWGHRLAGHPQAVPWGELLRLAAAAADLLAAAPPAEWAAATDAIGWYVGGGWRMDHAGEEITRALQLTAPELVRLVAPLRRAYRTRWEETLIRWSDLWSATGCALPPTIATAGQWLKTALDGDRHATAIVVVDALRFDLGARLATRINEIEGVERAQVSPARSALPSVTALGMAFALPIEEQKLTADLVEGRWQISAAGAAENLSLADKRRSWWLGNVPGVRLCRVEEVLSDQPPAPGDPYNRLVLYDGAIDDAGHDDQLEYFGGSHVLNRYLQIVERLRNAGWLRILVVTDHGYIHWPVNEEKNTPHPVPGAQLAARRYLVYGPDADVPLPRVSAPGNRWQVALPRGAASFKAYGGLGYFHGGASLQEWIIPCVHIEWPQQARPVTVTIEPVERIMSQRPKVTLTVSAGTLLREDAIARQVEVVIRDRQTRALLFRSERATASIDTPQIDLTLDAVAGAAAARNSALVIEVRDPHTEQRLDEQQAILMIELSGW